MASINYSSLALHNHAVVQCNKIPYIGRFAPSPSGPLHFGSLYCALASYLHAKQQNGRWLVRIEDTDTPRVEQGSSKAILNTLQAHGLQWDDDVIYQSKRLDLYNDYLSTLNEQQYLYACACSRSQIRARSDVYDGHCRDLQLAFAKHAIRLKHINDNSTFTDLFLGKTTVTHSMATEDPVLKRADGIPAYHLAVVVDDIEQQVNHVVRGNDLLETTPIHISLYHLFNKPVPKYMHLPIVARQPNEKLSKQHYSPAIDNAAALDNLKLALTYLGLSGNTIPKNVSIEQLLYWAVDNWHLNLIPNESELLISVINDVYSKPQAVDTRNINPIINGIKDE